MNSSHNRKIVPMEDDEDLELLRLEALKTLQSKKENVPAPSKQQHTQPLQQPMNNRYVVSKSRYNDAIPSRSTAIHGGPPQMDKFYPENDMVQPNLIHHPMPPYVNVNTGFEKMDINEPFIPQRISANVDSFNGFPTFNGPSTIDEKNVQLSPRTAAFVNANKEILNRRRMSKSKSPGRWSRSPSRESWKYRRSVSRSPPYQNHSPSQRNRSITPSARRRRSPLPPGPAHNRDNRSRSPIPRNHPHDNNGYRSEKRSPNRSRVNQSPPQPQNNARNGPKSWRPHSPHRNNGPHPRKSNSPARGDDSNYRNRRQRSRSPIHPKPDVKRRTLSRSPNRKYPRNTNPNLRRGRRTPTNGPVKRFNNNRQNNPNQRNRNYNGRRSISPAANRGASSKTPPNQQKRASPSKNVDEVGKSSNKTNDKEPKVEKDQENEKKSENDSKEKTEQDIENELLASTDDEKSGSDDDDDGIDLFASEESESENEGRFKSSSSKTERKTTMPTVSFSELGKTATASADVLRDLDELQTESTSSYRKGNSRRENGRDGNARGNNSRRDNPRYNDKRSYGDRDRDRERDRGTRERENRDSNRTSSSGIRKKESDPETSNSRNERKPITFKASTETESRTKTPDAEKNADTKDRTGDEKRGSVLLKRSNKNSEKDSGTRTVHSSIVGSTSGDKQRSSPSNETGGNGGSGGKKSIHARLGAMTQTWKTNKKPWRSEKVFSIQV